jgi:hypothetical protein
VRWSREENARHEDIRIEDNPHRSPRTLAMARLTWRCVRPAARAWRRASRINVSNCFHEGEGTRAERFGVRPAVAGCRFCGSSLLDPTPLQKMPTKVGAKKRQQAAALQRLRARSRYRTWLAPRAETWRPS